MFKKITALVAGLFAGLMVTAPAFALDTVAAIASITAASTDVEAIAVAVISVATVMLGISKIRQLIKA